MCVCEVLDWQCAKPLGPSRWSCDPWYPDEWLTGVTPMKHGTCQTERILQNWKKQNDKDKKTQMSNVEYIKIKISYECICVCVCVLCLSYVCSHPQGYGTQKWPCPKRKSSFHIFQAFLVGFESICNPLDNDTTPFQSSVKKKYINHQKYSLSDSHSTIKIWNTEIFE